MPILDSILQYHLLEKESSKDDEDCFEFYLLFLLIASKNVQTNFSSMKTLMQFKEDIKSGVNFINYKFCCKLSENNLNNPSITNFYKFMFNQLIKGLKINIKKSIQLEGSYFKQSDNSSTVFFQPNIFFSKNHSWFLSDSPIAVLCINFNNFSYGDVLITEFFKSIQIETDLLAASGFTLVLCTTYCYPVFLFELIQRNQFAEIHFNCLEKNDINDFLLKIKNGYESKLDSFTGYFYLYSTFVDKESELNQTFKKLKSRPHFYCFTFAFDLKSTLKSIKFKKTRPFPYCKVGFKYDQIRIRLSNVPYYDNDSDELCSIPSETSGTSICSISKSDFFNWRNKRVKVICYDESLFHSYSKYILFEDAHRIKRELYVKDTLFLTRIDKKTLEDIDKMDNEIKSIIKKRRNKKFKKKMFFSFYEDKLIKNSIEYVAYAYAWDQSLKGDFLIHKSQLYAVLKASKLLLAKTTFSQKLLIKQKKYLQNLLYSNSSESENVFSQNIQKVLNIPDLNNEIKRVLLENLSMSKTYFNPAKKLSPNKRTNSKEMIKSQIENIDKILSSNDVLTNSKGVIYQVETGEGKSCIISLIAAILALNGKTVHITSSNIKLANRDYMNSFNFFKMLGLKSAVLLHDNELPYATKRKKTNLKKSTNNINIDDEEINKLFKDNEDNYYQTYTQDDNSIQFKKYYQSDFYAEKQFKNPSRMNMSVCDLETNQIIFSTFVNFECYYLKLLETNPGYVDYYFDKCALLIDEADSMLIDEIANGTIVSRGMKSNAKEVLTYVYNNYKEGVAPEKTLEEIYKNWPKCYDLTLIDIQRMYDECNLVNNINQKNFENGKKYSIEEFEVKNDKKKKKLIKKTLNFVKNIVVKVGKGLIKAIDDDGNEDEEEDEDENEDEVNEEEEEENDEPVTVFRRIVPFDYDHKGILEPNKEFSGYIQQFIAIKESLENKFENIVMNDISMSYLYVSHPIFVKLYGKICGFTGTIGKRKDRDIYKEQYNLTTFKIPRHVANQRVEFPIILCKTIKDRNEKIVSEVVEFHKRRNPVLVIFQDLNEIIEVGKLLNIKGIKYYNVFNGKNQNVTPEKIAGQESSVSLGTNVCGRGTNIITNGKPLHVIISYYTSNSRVINQAHGRTARQGQKGTSRIICLKEQFLHPSFFAEKEMEAEIEEFRIKNEMQAEYIELFKTLKPWVFINDINKQQLTNEDIKTMREIRINVNRIVAYNYEFPVKMSIETFLKIQSQKIFSILNCPNSMYTWQLFQRYIREMILQSWSLMINNADEIFRENEKYQDHKTIILSLDFSTNEQYNEEVEKFNQEYSSLFKRYKKELYYNFGKLIDLINQYLPFDKRYIVPSFMHIIDKVKNSYETPILKSFKTVSECYFSYNKIGFMSCQIGFKPFSLLSKSGARITYKTLKKQNYIKDPELSYLKKTKKKICLLSITEQIDDIFNQIFQKINQILGEKTFLKLFMRRMICGCEFGVCFDFSFNNESIKDPICFVDKDPLILFTINLRSMVPVLAGVLFICLTYLTFLAKDMAMWIIGFQGKLTNEIIKHGIFIFCNALSDNLVIFVLEKTINFLEKTLNDQLNKLENIHSNVSKIAINIIKSVKTIFDSSIGEKMNEGFSSFLGEKIKNKFNWESLQKKYFYIKIDIKQVVRISMLLLFCLATFIMNFNIRKDAIENSKETAKEYNKDVYNNGKKKKSDEYIQGKITDLRNRNSRDVKDEIRNNTKPKNTLEEEIITNQIKDKFEKESNTFYYQYKKFSPINKIVKLTEFYDENEEVLNDVYNLSSDIRYCFKNNGNVKQRFKKFQYKGFRNVLIQQVYIYAENKCPSILGFIGYSIQKKKEYLIVEDKENGTLGDIINNSQHNRIKPIRKLIIAYGVAHAMKYLHENKFIHRNLKTSNICLDCDFYPFISDFCYAVQLKSPLPYILTEMTPEFTAPEFIQDYKNQQFSYKLDVYAYGIILFMLMTDSNPFADLSSSDILNDTLKGKRPKFTESVNVEWKNLITNCWNQNPSQRPSFNEICETIDGFHINDSNDSKIFKKYKKILKI